MKTLIILLLSIALIGCGTDHADHDDHETPDQPNQSNQSNQQNADHQHDHGEPASPTLADRVTGKEYTCPMHPQIVRDQPGNCPICGMELVERRSDASDTDSLTITGPVQPA